MKSSRARQVVLGLTAGVFTLIAIGSLASPHGMAAGLGYTLTNTDALNEFRAIYVGLWLATAAIFVFASRRIENALLGDLCALLLLGQVAGRVVSLLLDGMPSGRIWPTFVAEILGGVALFAIRPSGRSEPPGS